MNESKKSSSRWSAPERGQARAVAKRQSTAAKFTKITTVSNISGNNEASPSRFLLIKEKSIQYGGGKVGGQRSG